jgi:hypothetical protein
MAGRIESLPLPERIAVGARGARPLDAGERRSPLQTGGAHTVEAVSPRRRKQGEWRGVRKIERVKAPLDSIPKAAHP